MVIPNPELGVWLYYPSFALAVVATIIFFIPAALHLFLIIKYRSWYFIWVFVGAALEFVGYAARIASTRDYHGAGAYAMQSTLIILAPLFVAAGNYLLISRLIRAVLPKSQRVIFRITPSWLTGIFVICDIGTFLIQATGAAIVASGIADGSPVTAGSDILIAGLSIQIITFGAFIVLILTFHSRVKSMGRVDYSAGWMKILFAIYISTLCIMIRTIYRLVEFGLGIDGYPFSHEWIFYVFESLPILLAIAIFCIFHPGKHLPKEPAEVLDSSARNLQLEERQLR